MTRSMKLILLIGILLLSNISVHNIASADSTILPKIGAGQITPVNDGNITRSEYNTSASFDTQLFNQQTTVFVTSNSTHLFIGFNITTSSFVGVNDTLPTTSGYQLGYNNATHDWFAIVIDNNLDESFPTTLKTLGTTTSPDDAVVLDQYVTGSYDGYVNGTTSFMADNTQTYTNGNTGNVTTILGNNGQNNVISSRLVTSTQVSYEITKPLTNMDTNGSDFVMAPLDILKFAIYQVNGQANDTLLTGTVDHTDWFSLRLNDTGNAPTLADPATSNINVIYNTVAQDQFTALDTLAKVYNFTVSYNSTVETSNLAANALNILVVGSDTTGLNTSIIDNYVRDGGNLMIALAPGAKVNDLLKAFGLKYLPNNVLVGGQNSNTTQLDITNFNTDLPIASAGGIFTNRTFSNITMYGSALNTTELFNSNTHFILGQEFIPYNLFTAPDGVAYDANNNGTIDGTDAFNNLSLGVAIDLLKGGRLTVIPSLSLLEDGNATLANNPLYLLGLLGWNAQYTNKIKVNSVNVDRNYLPQHDSVNIEVNATSAFNTTVDNLIVQVEVVQAGAVKGIFNLTKNGDLYTAAIPIDVDGFVSLEVTAYSVGNGFAEGQTISVQARIDFPQFNDLSKLSPIIVGLFLVSLAVYALVIVRVKTYKRE